MKALLRKVSPLLLRARTAAARIQRRVCQVRDPEGVQGLLRVLVQQPHRV